MKKTLMAAVIVLAGVPGAALAQWAYQPRWEITPMAGYRTYGTLENTDVAKYSQLKFDSAFSWGAALGASFGPNFDADVTFSYTSTDVTAVGRPGNPTRTVGLTQYDTLFNAYYVFGGPRDSLRWYLGGGIGFTILSPDQNLDSLTRFAFSLAGGMKWYFSDHVGFRFEARWIPTYLYSTDGGTWCDPLFGCYYYSNDHMLQQGDFKAGVIFRF